jgi:hypothetical protein
MKSNLKPASAKKTNEKSRPKSFRKRLYEKKSVRIIHLILQYIIILVAPIIVFALLEYLWEERPGLLFVTIPGIVLTICSIRYFLTNKKIRASIEEEGDLPKEIRGKIIRDTIVLTAIFAAYIVIKCLIKAFN